MHTVDTTLLEWDLVVPNTRGGDVFRKVIRSAEGGTQVSYDIRIERYGEGDRKYESIRHRHDFEQLRFAVSGQMDLGVASLEEGDVAYFPANAFYGPQSCEGAVLLVVQWGDRFITKDQNDRAVAELSAVGEFHEGIYRSVDKQGRRFNKDPLNAIWEQVFGEPYVPRTPRYHHPIIMTPGAFGWSEAEGAVRRRRLGEFTEHRFAIEMVQWVDDGSLTVSSEDQDRRPTLLFTVTGTFAQQDAEFGPLTGVWGDAGESIAVTGAAGSQALVLRFPEPSSHITLPGAPEELSLARAV